MLADMLSTAERSVRTRLGLPVLRKPTLWVARSPDWYSDIVRASIVTVAVLVRFLGTRRNSAVPAPRWVLGIGSLLLAMRSETLHAATGTIPAVPESTASVEWQETSDRPQRSEPSTPKSDRADQEGLGAGGFGSGGFEPVESESTEAESAPATENGFGSGGFDSGGFGSGGFDSSDSSAGNEAIPEFSEREVPRLQYALGNAKQSVYIGDRGGAQFIDKAPDGALLVGFQVSISNDIFESIQGIRPIYQQEKRLLPGEWHGKAAGRITTLLPRPGYVVGGLLLREALGLKSIQVAFVAIREDGRLNAKDYYLSDPVGDTQFGQEHVINTDGRHVVGVFGRAHDKVYGLGLAALRATSSAGPNGESGPPAGDAKSGPGEPFRTWTSSNGKFTVQAQLQLIDGDKVVLLRDDGKTTVVEISKLCDADRQYLQARPAPRR